MTFCAPSETLPIRRGPSTLFDPKVSDSFQTPLMGLSKDPPLRQHTVARPLPVRPKPHLRSVPAKVPTRSVPVVPPDFDGLLRATACRFVAPYSQPWGPPRFLPCSAFSVTFRSRSRPHGLPRGAAHTLRSVPPPASRTVSPRPLPSRRCDCSTPARPPCCHAALPGLQHPPDLKALLQQEVRCQLRGVATSLLPVAPLGFVPLQGLLRVCRSGSETPTSQSASRHAPRPEGHRPPPHHSPVKHRLALQLPATTRPRIRKSGTALRPLLQPLLSFSETLRCDRNHISTLVGPPETFPAHRRHLFHTLQIHSHRDKSLRQHIQPVHPTASAPLLVAEVLRLPSQPDTVRRPCPAAPNPSDRSPKHPVP